MRVGVPHLARTVIVPLVLGLAVVLLMVDLMGVVPFLLSALLYLVSFFVGHAINWRVRCVLLQNPSLFEGLGVVAFETVLGMGVLALLLFLSRAVGASDWVVLGPALALAVVVLALSVRSLRLAVMRKWDGAASVSLLAVVGLLALLAISDSMVSDGSALYFRDTLHPLYELSTAKSTTFAGLVKSDLSYAGKDLQFHMLGPLWASVLEETFHIDGLAVVYRVLPIWQLLLCLSLMAFLVKRISGDDVVAATTPALALFLTELVLLPVEVSVPGVDTSLLLGRFVIQPSTAVGLTALLAFLILCISPSRPRLRGGTVVISMVFAAFTFFSKAFLIAPLLAVLGLLAARDFVLRRQRFGLVFVGLLAAAILPFALLVLGAHRQNFWAVVPSVRHFTWLVERLHAESSWPLQLLAWIFSLPIGALGTFGLLPLGVYWGWRFYQKSRQDSGGPPYHPDTGTLVFGSAALGLLMTGLVSEFTEGNDYQFALGYFWLGWVGLILWYRRRRNPKWLHLAFMAVILMMVLNNLSFTASPLVPYRADQDFSDNPLVVRAKMAAVDSVHLVLGMPPDQDEWKRSWLQYPYRFLYVAPQGFPLDLYETVRALKGLPESAVVLRGRHYEDLGWESRRTSTDWHPDTTFFASGISGEQFVIEDFKYKGIAVQKDYSQRSGNVFRFYWWCVDRKQDAQQADGWVLPPGDYVPEGSEVVIDLPLVRALTIKGNPSWYSARRENYEMLVGLSQEFAQASYSVGERIELCRTILDRYGVTDIMFERGEKPDPQISEALGLTRTITNSTVSVFRYPRQVPSKQGS